MNNNIRILFKLLIAFSIPMALMAFIAIVENRSFQKQINHTSWVEHTYKVIADTRQLMKLMIDMETGQRGFLITGKEHYLEPYDAATRQWDLAMRDMQELVSDNPPQVVRLQEISELEKSWRREAGRKEINLRRDIDAGRAEMADLTELLETDTGKRTMDTIRQKVDEFIAIEEDLMEQRKADARASTQFTENLIIYGTGATILLAAALAFWVSKPMVDRIKMLLAATREIGAGRYASIPQLSQDKDEIGDLGRSFNEMAKTLNKSRTDMLKAYEAKGLFLANMSHEIRTPMNGMLGIMEMLESTPLNADQKKYLELMRFSGNGLLVVINDILDFSRLDAGKVEIEQRPLEIAKSIENCIELIRPETERKGIQLSYQIDRTIPKALLGDQERICQIINNLLNNAVKFTSSGSISVKAVKHAELDQRCEISIAVADTGIGISKEAQASIFDSFSQEDTTTTRRYGGTGLGLAISSKLVKAMGGEIAVESESGAGSTFTVKLSFAVGTNAKDLPPEPLLSEKTANAETENLSEIYPLKILAAEDNKLNQRTVAFFLEAFGYDCDIVEDGQAAIVAVAEKDYDLVLLDMQMPVMGGVEAAEKIIKIHGTERPKLIAMTANVLPEHRQECLNAGMDDFLAKPFTRQQLRQAIVKAST